MNQHIVQPTFPDSHRRAGGTQQSNSPEPAILRPVDATSWNGAQYALGILVGAGVVARLVYDFNGDVGWLKAAGLTALSGLVFWIAYVARYKRRLAIEDAGTSLIYRGLLRRKRKWLWPLSERYAGCP